MELHPYKEKANEIINGLKKDLYDISADLCAHPEVAYEEVRSARILREYLDSHGFDVEEALGGIETAFRAQAGTDEKGPKFAFVAEYDALPEVGHGCAHNLIAAGAIGAAIGVAGVLKTSDLTGIIQVIGAPAEEYTLGKSGKIRLLEAGVFNTLDVSLMFHPFSETSVIMNDLGFTVLDAKFQGKGAHAAVDPHNGLNALDGVVLTYNALSLLRQQVKSEARIHIIITEGGSAVNVIPDTAALRVMLRSHEVSYLEELERKTINCIEGAAKGTASQANPEKLTTVLSTNFNRTLYDIVADNFQLFGEELKIPESMNFSSDFGNVTHALPAFAFTIKTHRAGIPWHSVEVRDESTSDIAIRGVMIAAKVMAMSAIDIMLNPDRIADMREEFHRSDGG